MKIGISFYQRDAGVAAWENGAGQNTYFLLELLLSSPFVEMVYLVNFSAFDGFSSNFDLKGHEHRLVRFSDVKDELDILIEASIQVPREDVIYLRQRGCAFVGYRMGNDYIIDVERMLFNRTEGIYWSGVQYDELWTHEQHVNTCKSYWETIYNAPVFVLPHIWSSFFIDQSIKELASNTQLTFGYCPGYLVGKIAVFEPNQNLVKTAITPTLVIENAYRENSNLISHAFITNGLKLAKTKAWMHMVNSLNIFRDKKITTEPRYQTAFFLSRWASVVVSHQWENSLNYLYYDVLYGNYPLIHNSPLIKEYGYYYQNFDASAGGRQLINSISSHDQNIDHHRKNNKILLNSVNSVNPKNIDAHMYRISTLIKNKKLAGC